MSWKTKWRSKVRTWKCTGTNAMRQIDSYHHSRRIWVKYRTSFQTCKASMMSCLKLTKPKSSRYRNTGLSMMSKQVKLLNLHRKPNRWKEWIMSSSSSIAKTSSHYRNCSESRIKTNQTKIAQSVKWLRWRTSATIR